MPTLQDRIDEILADPRGIRVGDLAEAAGVTSSAVSQWRSPTARTLALRSALGIQARYGYSAEWLSTGKGPKFVKPPVQGVDHAQSHEPKRIETQRFKWEQLVTANLGDTFLTAMPDDSAAPEYPRGTEIIWSTIKKPQIGSLVLLRDAHGTMHAREYRQGKAPGQWLAVPINRAYATFDGAEVEVVAVGAQVVRDLP
jgi:hypothetical protein